MATVTVHECDRCGRTLRMDSDFAQGQLNNWMVARFAVPESVTYSNKVPKTVLYCGSCAEQVQLAIPRPA